MKRNSTNLANERFSVHKLTVTQEAAVQADQSLFLLGSAGSGKSTALGQRLLRLLGDGEPAYTILVLVAESEHTTFYFDTIHRSGLGPYAELALTTYNQLARQMVSLFWPLVARPAGFLRPFQPPSFLTYDLAQLLMWRTIAPLLADGAFADLRLRPQQVVSQLLDTLNRAALNSLRLDQAAERQSAAWVGPAERLVNLADAAEASYRFRQRCLANNLLDLSLLVEVFDTQLVNHPEFRRYFSERFRHLIIDNVEEQTPAGQNFIAGLMDVTASAAIAYDDGGGYKRFLAADPDGALDLARRCKEQLRFEESFSASPALIHLANEVENRLEGSKKPAAKAPEALMAVIGGRYRHEMVANLTGELANLLSEGLPANQIAIIAPYLDGALQYMLANSFKDAGIPALTLRRRSRPRDEPRVRAWLTWLALAHPDWGLRISPYEVAEALTLTVAGADPARAQLLIERLFLPGIPALLPVAELPERITERAGWQLISLVEELRVWLSDHGNDRYSLDEFLQRLFHDLLARPRFQPEPDLAGAAVCDWLARTAARLRQAAGPMGLQNAAEIGESFVSGIYQGLVSANPPDLGEPPDPDGILISTIYGYLLAGHPVEVQVWLDTAASGWWDLPSQPLSNAFVLAQSWPAGKQWRADEDFRIRNQILSRIIRGLTSRCTNGVILASSDLDRRGIRQDGSLWRALQMVMIR